MLSERTDVLVLDRLIPSSNPTLQGYYRSKLYAASPTTNPFLAAASPLFSLLERFTTTQTLPSIQVIKENIDHEWRAYRSRLTRLTCTNDFVVIAEYLMSATIDELIGKTYLRLHGTPAEFVSYTPSTLDEDGPEKHFFKIVTFMKKRTLQYLDLIELAYYCLICGFEGELHLRADGRNTLDNLIHELYELIQHHRSHKPIRLFKEPPPASEIKIAQSNHISWKSLLIGVGGLIALYFISVVMLEKRADSIYIDQEKRMNMDN